MVKFLPARYSTVSKRTKAAGTSLPVLVVYGPTASGKTRFVLEGITAASPIPIEIISADSMQVYRGLDIGTAKPSDEERRRTPHHLIDIRNPDESYDAQHFALDACRIIAGIRQRGNLPVVVGGTGFYLRSLVFGLGGAPRSPEIMRALEAELEASGPQGLRKRLELLDPQSAAEIAPKDVYRTLRALEIVLASGQPRSSFRVGRQVRAGFRFGLVGINPPRQELYRRIDERCAKMFASGLRAEWEGLLARGYREGDAAMRAIGYREFFLGLDDAHTLSTVAKNSRNYAKRQITFFKSLFPKPDLSVETALSANVEEMGGDAAKINIDVLKNARNLIERALLDKES